MIQVCYIVEDALIDKFKLSSTWSLILYLTYLSAKGFLFVC
jgi:hypothetical protein